ncbi:MAG: LysE family translocator, partial [Comamonadaceae bacterium]|nr:LysE family translocator [Comamonadaceae bacterium]
PPLGGEFLLAALLIELVPGPNMSYLALVAASTGRRAGLATVAGVALGLAVVGLVAALGVAELIQASAWAYEGLRWLGVAFLLYLAASGWRGAGAGTEQTAIDGGQYFRRGLVTNLLNPKAGVFYVSVLPTFIAPEQPAMAQAVALTLLYVAVATLIHLLIVALAGALQPLLRHPRRERTARRALSALLALVALWFAWQTAR